MVAEEVLALIRCPQTRQRLRLATSEELARLPDAATEALIREDGRVAYPIRDGIPVLLIDAAITLSEA